MAFISTPSQLVLHSSHGGVTKTTPSRRPTNLLRPHHYSASSFIPCSRVTIIQQQQQRRHQRSSTTTTIPTTNTTSAKLDALIFDCDGVLAETERDAHRVAFNLAFSEQGLSVDWDPTLYGNLLKTGGGKERMTAYWDSIGWPAGFPSHESQRALVKQLHARKTQLFMSLVEQGNVPLRPGVQRLVEQAVKENIPVAVCSTSNELAVRKIVDMLNVDGIKVFAGDVVQNKKPAPDIYLLALNDLGIKDAGNTCVIEDSHIGLAAATAAGMPTVVTKSIYTQNEDFEKAALVLNSLDDPLTTLDDLTVMVDSLKKVRA